MIKKAIYLIALALFFNCSSDDNGNNSAIDDPILGKWGKYKDVFLATGETDYYAPYYEIDTFYPDGTGIIESIIIDGLIDVTWDNLGDNIYKMTVFGITVNSTIEFTNENEFILYYSTGDEAAYYRRVFTDSELSNKMVGDWKVLESCESNLTYEDAIYRFYSSGNLDIEVNFNGTLETLNANWYIENGSLYMTPVDTNEPIVVNVFFNSNDKMSIEQVSDSNGEPVYSLECLLRVK